MADDRFIKTKKQTKNDQKWLCRLHQHRVFRNQIAIQHDKHQGICGRCVGRQTQRHEGDTIDLASYWTRDWPAESIGFVGPRRTWAQSRSI